MSSVASPVPVAPTGPNTPPVRFVHRVEYVAARLAVGALRLLGWRVGGALGGRLAQLVYRPIGIRRAVSERQIAAAFPEFDASRVELVARRAYDSLGRTSIEAAILGGTPPAAIKSRFLRVDGWDLFMEARARGKGVIVVTGHVGNWELGAAYVTATGIPLGAVARRMANPLFDQWLTRTRARNGMDVIYDGDAVRRAPRLLRDGGVVAFLCDQDGLGLASTFVPFFGRPAKTPRGPAVFALRLNVPVFFAASVRMPDGRYVLHFEPVPVIDTGNREADVDAVVLAYTQRLEATVRQYPEQYFWQHRRWRRQPEGTPAHLREP